MATQLEVVAGRLQNAEDIVRAAKNAGLYLPAALAMIQKESGGRNVWGSDVGGTNSGKKGNVTEVDFKAFAKKVAAGAKSNGVGVAQITYPAYFPMAENQGIKLWLPYDNALFGFRILRSNYEKQKDWARAGTLYNKGNLTTGVNEYGKTFAALVKEWESRLASASADEEETTMPAAWYPKAVKREIRPGSSDPAIKVRGAILHVDAGNSASLYNYFNGPSNGIESHFHITKTGKVEQYRGLDREADANYKGNSFVLDGTRWGYVSIETQGLEKGQWTPEQLAAIKELLTWLSKEHDFPLVVTPTPTSKGVGFHTLHGAPGAWTPVSKSCPGPDRKKQFYDELVPWMKGETKPAPAPPKPPVSGNTYTVKSGDTLTKIADDFDTTVEALAKLNGLKDPNSLNVGQVLKVGGTKPAPVPPKPAPAKPVVDLSNVVRAAKTDPRAKSGTFTAKADVLLIEQALVKEGFLPKSLVDGHYGTATISAYSRWQKSPAGGNYRGSDADGIPGRDSLTRLGKRHGWTVKA
jgi:LysM repeat protein